MHLRHVGLSIAVLSLTALGLFGAPSAQAAPAAPATSQLAFRFNKTVLTETSIDGPALYSVAGSGSQGVIRGVMGWTGTDPAHHLTVMTSIDGIHFDNKHILNETSFARPSVIIAPRIGYPSEPAVVVAWTGMDANHSLNILYDVYGAHPQKLTLWSENSFAAPALGALLYGVSAGGGKVLLVLGWAGTDANHSLNLRIFDPQAGLKPVNKTIAPAAFNSVAGPTFALDTATLNAPGVVMTWAARAPLHRIAYSRLSWNGTQWMGLSSPTFAQEWSASSPGFFFAQTFMGLWAWTGLDLAHTLNTIWAVFSSTPQKVTLQGETALGGPALGGTEQAGQFVLAWTGTDAAHHLNVATMTV